VLKLLCTVLNSNYAVLASVCVQYSFCYTDSSIYSTQVLRKTQQIEVMSIHSFPNTNSKVLFIGFFKDIL